LATVRARHTVPPGRHHCPNSGSNRVPCPSSQAGPACVGVQLDEWKLLAGFNDGGCQLSVFDVRSLSGPSPGGSGWPAGGRHCAARRPWTQPLMALTAPARIQAFQVRGARLRTRVPAMDSAAPAASLALAC
jgi:hypothetical protein